MDKAGIKEKRSNILYHIDRMKMMMYTCYSSMNIFSIDLYCLRSRMAYNLYKSKMNYSTNN